MVKNGEDTAKDIYKASLDGDNNTIGSGVQMYERPYLWRDDSPTTAKDTFTENFIPTPALNTNDRPRWLRVLGIVAAALVTVAIAASWLLGLIFGW